MDESTRRVVVLGKTGAGKSSLSNTVFGEKAFKIDQTAKSGTTTCQAKVKCVNGRDVMWIDTPGFFDTDRTEEEMKREIVSCITECVPGPHVFLILLKVEKITKHEQEVVEQMQSYFSEDAFKFTVVVFSHGDDLPEGMKIEEFVEKCKYLKDLVKKCGGRCHVFDNKYWQNKEHEYRNNQFQVEELLKTIDRMIEENTRDCYTNEMLKAVESNKQQEQEKIQKSSPDKSLQEVRHITKTNVFEQQMLTFAGVTAVALLRVFLDGENKLMSQEKPTDEENKRGRHTNEMLRAVKSNQQQGQEMVRQSPADKSPEENIHVAKTKGFAKMLKCAVVGVLLGAVVGGAMTWMGQEEPKALVGGIAIGTAAGVVAAAAL